jgi:hypothetical protein
VTRAFRERLEVTRDDHAIEKAQNLIAAEETAPLERYLDPFILMMLCQADETTTDEWLRRFRTVDVTEVGEKCMRRAADEFEVLQRGPKFD